MNKNPLSFQLNLNPEDFLPASDEEKQSQVVMRESVSFWKDGMRRLRKNKVAMVSLVIIILVMILSFIVPSFYPYNYKDQIKGANNLKPMQYSAQELERIEAGEKVFPHIFGTDKMGRDYAIRVMMGSRISLLVGLIATGIILIIGSVYGSIAAFFGGRLGDDAYRRHHLYGTGHSADSLAVLCVESTSGRIGKCSRFWMGKDSGREPDQYFRGVCPSILGGYGTYGSKPGADVKRK